VAEEHATSSWENRNGNASIAYRQRVTEKKGHINMYWFRVEEATREQSFALFEHIDQVRDQLGGVGASPKDVQAALAKQGIAATFTKDPQGCYIWKSAKGQNT
jgi:hypothetical protein